jgi:hypothetical protein
MTMQENDIIILKAVWGKTQGSLLLNPVRDDVTGKFKGVEELNEEELRKSVRPVYPDTQRKITDGLKIDRRNQVDKIDWEWIKENKEIVGSIEEARSSPQALFYIDQPDKELEKRLAKSDLVFEAETIVRGLSVNEQIEMCRLLGQNVKGYRPIDVRDYLLERSHSAPAKILDAKADPNAKEKLFLFDLVDAGKVKKDQAGMYKFGDIILGLNTRSAIEWLNDKKNRDIVGKLYTALYNKDEVVSSSVISDFSQVEKPIKNKSGGQAGEADQVKVEEQV